MNPSDTLLYNASDLLEYIGVFLVHPVCQVSAVIKDLTHMNINITKETILTQNDTGHTAKYIDCETNIYV